jgi:hypothetical protein
MVIPVGQYFPRMSGPRFAAEAGTKDKPKIVVQVTPTLPKPTTTAEWIPYFERHLVAITPDARREAQNELQALADGPKIEIITALSTHKNEYVRAGAAQAVASISKARKADRDTLVALFCRDLHPVPQHQGIRALPWVTDKALRETLLSELKPLLGKKDDANTSALLQARVRESILWAIRETSPKGQLKRELRALLTGAIGWLDKAKAALQ